MTTLEKRLLNCIINAAEESRKTGKYNPSNNIFEIEVTGEFVDDLIDIRDGKLVIPE